MSDQTEREARLRAEAIDNLTFGHTVTNADWLDEVTDAVIAVADQEQAVWKEWFEAADAAAERRLDQSIEWMERAEFAEARVRELEAALQQSRDDHQGAVEKLRAVEARRTAESEALAEALNEEQSRAEAAEARLRAVEALADEFDLPRERGGGDYGPFYAEKLRAALRGES